MVRLPSFFRRRKPKLLNEFTVLGAFAAVAAAGVIFGALLFLLPSLSKTEVLLAQQKAPTIEEYRSETRSAFKPFLVQASAMTDADVASAGDTMLGELAQKTQERLLRIRVPKEEREAHLSFVLLLDQWKRAIGGSVIDQRVVLKNTAAVVAQHPWLME